MKTVRILVALAATIAASPLAAHAQDWPNRAVRMIVPFAAGGSTDVAARLVAEHLTRTLGQQVVVENRTGANGVIGIESRGFILGSAVADRIGAGFIPIRKPGKLPAKRMREAYALEYGTDALEIHEDAVQTGQRVLIVDDVLATGGTAAAAARLVKQLGGELQGLAFLIELLFLSGKAKLPGEKVYSVVQY